MNSSSGKDPRIGTKRRPRVAASYRDIGNETNNHIRIARMEEALGNNKRKQVAEECWPSYKFYDQRGLYHSQFVGAISPKRAVEEDTISFLKVTNTGTDDKIFSLSCAGTPPRTGRIIFGPGDIFGVCHQFKQFMA